jgi:hypothetical protein
MLPVAFNHRFWTSYQDMLGDLMSSVQPIEIKIFGTDQKIIEDYSKK